MALAILSAMRSAGLFRPSRLKYFSCAAGCLVLLTKTSLIYAQTPAANPAPAAAAGQTAANRGQETLIKADRMKFDQNTNIATATGHVEIIHGGYILRADQVTYNQNTNVMHAHGHIAMLTPGGEVQFAEDEEVTGDMNQAFARNIGILFPDNSRLGARAGERYNERYTVLSKAGYTACNVCKQDPDNPPLWQLNAQQIVHDNTDHEIYYHDATVDFAGVPVLYTPYISTPDPTVERRQGFLTTTPGYNPEIGYFVRVPYYFDIAPETDATLAPTFSDQDKVQMEGQIRHRFDQGQLQFDSSLTYADLLSENTGADKGEHLRGDLMGTSVYDINNIWRAGTDVDYVSDKSYFERYRMSSPSETTNRVYLEGFDGRDYAAVNSYYFQDLVPGSQPVQPFVLPSASFSALGEPGQTLGGRWSLEGSTLETMRDNSNTTLTQQGPDTRRLSLNGGWERQFESQTGFLTTVSGLARTDGYWADNVPNADNTETFNNVMIARQFEQANIVTSYPVGRHGENYQQIVEPIASVTVAPDFKPDPLQPIEDSLDVEFDETNLFSPNRFTGNDLIEGGSRATYGLRQQLIAGSAHLNIFGGQSYDFSENSDFPGTSGLRDHASDYVGRIDASPGQWLDMNYGFRLDQTTLSPQAQDAHLSFGDPVFRPFMEYISAYEVETPTGFLEPAGIGAIGTLQPIEEATIGFNSAFAKYWHLAGSHIQSFQPQPGPRYTNFSVNYVDECLIAGVEISHDDTNRVDISSGTSVVFHLILKNVGGIKTDSFNGIQFPAEFRQTE